MNGRIAALSGRVPELTAAQLDGMDAAALAALYSSGVRLLMVKNHHVAFDRQRWGVDLAGYQYAAGKSAD